MSLILKSNYLKLYIGCMFSGKSTSLLNEISRYKIITDKIVVVNHLLDKQRQNKEINNTDNIDNLGYIKTHSNKSHNAYMISKLNELKNLDDYKTCKIIIIDEAQFFDDLYEFILSELKDNTNPKIFIVGGLSGDYLMNPLGEINRLVSLSDEIIKLNAYCVKCNDGTIASFTKRTINGSSQIIIGASDIYIPVCRYHHLEKID